jgi:predicted Fe-Mo cluster-binding NifX family protein
MRIAASTDKGGLDDIVTPQFGRTPSFTIVEFDGSIRSVEVVINAASKQSGGAGIAASQLMVDRGVEVVLTGNVGPKAMNVLKAANIRIYRADGLKVEEAVKKLAKGELEEIQAPGRGMGKGSGGGWR